MRFVLAALALALTTGPARADEMDDAVTLARSCFESEGGPSARGSVFGWCDPVWGYARRQRCSETIAARWEGVMQSYWGELRPVAETYDAANNRDSPIPVWEAIVGEQKAWLEFREASCAIDLTGEYIVTGREEERAICEADLTQARVETVYQRLLWMRRYVDDYR